MRNYFVITGPPGSGKTPLVRELIARGFAGVPEPAREVLREQRALSGAGVPERDPALFCRLMLSRSIDDFCRLRDANEPVFFDRAIPDLAGYAAIFGLDAVDELTAARTYRYNEIVFMTPSWAEIYTTDDERTMSFEMADTFGRRIRDIYLDLGYRVVDVPRTDPHVRAGFIADVVAETLA